MPLMMDAIPLLAALQIVELKSMIMNLTLELIADAEGEQLIALNQELEILRCEFVEALVALSICARESIDLADLHEDVNSK